MHAPPGGRHVVPSARAGPAPSQQLGRALRQWRPHKTPRLTLSLSLWLFGLYAALYATAPFPVSPQAEEAYNARMREADRHMPARAAAAAALAEAEWQVSQAKTWFWRWRPEDAARVRAAQAAAAHAAAAATVADAAWSRHVRAAKAELGVWSEAGVGEARKEFWKAYDGGKVFAQRHTFYDMIFAVLSGRQEENAFSFVLSWVMRVLANFTVGMCSAVISFIFHLPALLWSFQPSLLSGVLFFAVASLGASSVVGAYLGALYGVAGGTVFLAGRAAVANARLEDTRRAARAQQLRGGRPHGD